MGTRNADRTPTPRYFTGGDEVKDPIDRDLITIGNLTVDADTGEIIEQPMAFLIDSRDKLSWWLGKMRQLRALAESEIALSERAKARAVALSNAANRLEDHYREEAEPLVSALLPAGRRSIILDGGEVGFRTLPGSIQVRDEATALAWCKEHLPEAVKVVENLLKTPIAKLAKESGTLPPGVEQIGPGEKMWVR